MLRQSLQSFRNLNGHVTAFFLPNGRNGAFLHVELTHKESLTHTMPSYFDTIHYSKPLVVNYHGVRCEFERKTVSRLISALLTRRCESSKIMRTQVEKNRCAHGAKSEMYKVQKSTVYNPGKSLLRSQIEYMQY